MTDRQGRTNGVIRRFFGLPGREQALVVQAAVLCLAIRPALRVWGVQRVHERLERWLPVSAGETAEPEVRRLASLVESSMRQVAADRTCLERSLVLWFLGRRRGYDLTIALGARKGDAGLEAHAWVEHRGTVVNDAADVPARYAPLSWAAWGRRG